MDLTFPFEALANLLADAEKHWPNGLRARYSQHDPAGFWLVGDQGIYMMHNGSGFSGKPTVVFASECNPETQDFDHWWGVKNATFGSDDGVEFIDTNVVRRAIANRSALVIRMTVSTMEIFTHAPAGARQ